MAAPTITQSNSGFSNSTTTLAVSVTNNIAAGNMILVWIGVSQGITINTPTMTGETFTKVTGASNAGSAGNGQVALYASNSAVGGQKQVTATCSGGGSDLHVHLLEINGQIGSPQDATGNTESATLSVATSGSTTTANDLVVAFFYDNNLNHTFTAGATYATVRQSNNTTGGDVGYSESKTVSATGTQTATASGNAGDIVNQGIIAIAGTASSGGTFEDDTYNSNRVQYIEPVISVWA